MPQKVGPDGDARPPPGRNHEVDGIGDEHDGKESIERHPVRRHLKEAVERKGKREVGNGGAKEGEKHLFHMNLVDRFQKLGHVGKKDHDQGQNHEPDDEKRKDNKDFSIGLTHETSNEAINNEK